MAITLDRSKPHGAIYGDPHGRMFEQDGVFFTGGGDLWMPTEGVESVESVEAASQPAAKPKKPAAKAAPAPEGVDSQLAEQLKG